MRSTGLVRYPYFLLLLPLFFVFHGFVENLGLIPFKIAFELLIYYLIAESVLLFAAFKIYGSLIKASYFVALLFAFYFFFGSFHDFICSKLGNSFLTSYTFVLAAIFIVTVCFFVWFKRKLIPTTKGYSLITLLLLLWLTIDIIHLYLKIDKNNSILLNRTDINLSQTSKNPDIYLIVADEYAGEEELKTLLNYNNQGFLKQLMARGFHIISNSRSNYDFTLYSTASFLNMSYLKLDAKTNVKDLALCQSAIKNVRWIKQIKQIGYQVYNYSVFDIDDQPSIITDVFDLKYKLITEQTLLSRIQRDLGYHFPTWFFFNRSKRIYNYLNLNNLLFDSSLAEINRHSTNPKFVYTHLEMPHGPFYFDSIGNKRSLETLLNTPHTNRSQYVEYLLYANKKYIHLIDAILKSQKPKIVIFMSDHGYRPFYTYGKEKQYHFINMNAVFVSDSNYTQWYKGMSNVNQFRAVMNTAFDQKLPMIKDTTYIILD